MRAILVLPFLLLAPSQAQASEREALLDSLRHACREFPREDQWRQADDCRRAWFTAHEEAIWRLKLNPHGPMDVPPPS